MKKLLLIIVSLNHWACGTHLENKRSGESSEDYINYLNSLSSQVTDESQLELSSSQNNKKWSMVQNSRQEAYDQYMEDNAHGKDAFLSAPIGYNGLPAILFQLLPDAVPNIGNPMVLKGFTGLSKLSSDDLLPRGMAFSAPPNTPSLQYVQFTCGACHTGEITHEDGSVAQLIGGPSTTFDINGYRTFWAAAAFNEDFTFDNFKDALLARPLGSLYGADNIAKEMFDRAVFLGTDSMPAQGPYIIAGLKDSILTRGAVIGQTLGAYTYQGDMTLLRSSPGHVEAFGFATLAFAPQDEFAADPLAALVKYFAPMPGIADIMSVYKQSERLGAQWDGNIRSKLHRNLGAELGVSGSPAAVNFQNGVDTTQFVEELPAPVYPFEVKMGEAQVGKKVYEYACASCHETEYFMPVAEAGTEPGRARGLTAAARLLLVENLKASCKDPSLEGCQASDEDIIVPRQDNPGYLALPLTGIWSRAPYLHNGSIPTMKQLLIPESRASTFYTGSSTYDQSELGFTWDEGIYLYDTSILGYSNAGHDDIQVFNGGIDFSKYPFLTDSLIEYLKTL